MTTVASDAQNQYGDTFQSFGSNLAAAFSQPTSLVDTAVKDLIAIIQDLADAVLAVAQDLADAFLTIASDALNGFQTILETTLNIPILSWIFQEITGEPLTLLNLMSLLFALPATLIYKLLNNGTAPFAGQVQEYSRLDLQLSADRRLGFS
ncbi:MAG TPA: hypothetical protein VKJ45_24305 [Blastocatellia bacterium]|nr:hypothetical protein [Blastocatellia bacterium]